MIDAHVHFWQFDPLRDAWMNDNMEILQRDFLPKDLERIAAKYDVDGVIAVQADQSGRETNFLCRLSSTHKIIKGVVGWVDLLQKNLDEILEHYSKIKVLKGFRHILQAEPPGFMLQRKFIEGVKALKHNDFTYDILVYHKQLPEVIQFLEKLPDQKLIIDHCAKPAIKKGDIKKWESQMRIIAEYTDVYCKISGLVTEAHWHKWHQEDFYPYLDVVMECFGSERIVFCSDWPVIYTSATYGKWINVMKEYMKQFSKQQQDKFFSENAQRFYNI